MNPAITLYGTDDCEDTRQTMQHLDEAGIEYKYINIDHDPGARAWVEVQNDGKRKTPTVNVDGAVLSVPSDGELDTALKAKGLMPK